MKRIFLIPLLAFIFSSALAQKVTIKKGIAYVDDSAYCKVSGKSGLLVASTESEFSISSMADEELIFVKEREISYQIAFLDNSQKIYIDKNDLGTNWKLALVKMFVKNKVIENNKINEQGRRKFVLKYSEDEQAMPGTGNPGQSGELVERNKNADIMVIGDNIQQDFKIIARFTSVVSYSQGSKPIRTYSISLPNGKKVAEFSAEDFNAENNKLLILKTNAISTVNGVNGNTLGQQMKVLKQVAITLIEIGVI